MLVNNIAKFRIANGWSQQDLADRIDTTSKYVGKLERGERGLEPWLEKLAEAYGCDPGDIISNRDPWRKVAVAGYVGGGNEVRPYDDHPKGKGIKEVRAPVALGNVVGVIVDGESMMPRYDDGDVVFYRRDNKGADELLNRECIVRLLDGRMYLKKIHKGSTPETYTLRSHNAADIEDQTIDWAAEAIFTLRKDAPSDNLETV